MKRTAPKLTERQIEKQIVDLLEAHGWLVIRMNQFRTGGGFVSQGSVEKGMPDLLVRKPSGFTRVDGKITSVFNWSNVWAEVKRPGGKLRPSQEAWLTEARERGENVIVCESVEQAADAFGIRL